MPSKTSWCNKQLILQTVRSSGWIPIIYFLGLLFALPFGILRLYTDNKVSGLHPQEPMGSLYQYDIDIQFGLLIAVPVLMAIFLFRFLQVKQAAEMMHSLPLKREKIFHHYSVIGMIYLITPVVLITLIVLIMNAVIDLNAYFQMKDIFIWAGTTILLNLVMFTAGVLVAMMTGISIVQGVLTYIFLLFPAGITFLFVTNLNLLLFGFPGDYYLNRNIELMSPLSILATVEGQTMAWNVVGIYIAAVLILYGLSLYFYKKRKTESASEAIAFPKLRSVFKYGVTFCMMLFGGLYFGGREANSTGWLSFGYIIGALIGYYAAEMVLQKTWRVFRKVRGLLIFGASMAVVMIGIQTLGIYEDHVPEQDEIKQVVYANTPYIFSDRNDYYGIEFLPEALKEEKNIQAVRRLHQQIIEKKAMVQKEGNQFTETAFFYYELNSGRKVIRQYQVDREMFAGYFKDFQESEEYKRTSQMIFHLDAKDVDFFNISTQGPSSDRISVNNREDIEEFIKIYQKDVLAASYEESIYYENYGSYVEFFMNQERSVNLPLSPSYKEALQWLADKDLLDRISAKPEDIASIEIVKDNAQYIEMDSREIAAEIENRTDAVKIENKKQIDELLQRTTGWLQKHQYVAVIHYRGEKQVDVVHMDEKHAPQFVKEHFH